MLTIGSDFLKLTVYVAFFSVLLGFYGLPLHIMRDLFLSFRSFFKRVADFVRYRNATRDMNARYPDATPEEVGGEDVCIICREEMRPAALANDANDPPQRINPVAERMRPKKLPCGHILHFSCLRSWLERQQNCPTCRRPVVVTQRLQIQAGNAQALPGNAPGQPGGAGLPGNAADQPRPNRARVINFGPLRIGFGAGGGNLIDDLAQRIHNGDQRPQPEPHGDAGGPQHFGFGFGFGRRPNPRNQASGASSNTPIQAQLDQIERSLQQQITSLQVASDQLHTVQMLNNELVRLRNLQANSANDEAAVPQLANPPMPMMLPNQTQLPPIGWDLPPPPILLSNHQQQPLSSESDALPEGVTLPPGWTLLPLQRSDGPTRTVANHTDVGINQPASTGAPSVPQRTTATPPSQPFAGIADSFAPRSSPPAAASNGTHSRTPAVNSTTPLEEGPPLPSWGSASAQANGTNQVEQNGNSFPARNGEPSSEKVATSSDTAGQVTGKGKGKAATVEDLVDDVD
jgi:E3 ubiquitin-protein ligase synoviolin